MKFEFIIDGKMLNSYFVTFKDAGIVKVTFYTC